MTISASWPHTSLVVRGLHGVLSSGNHNQHYWKNKRMWIYSLIYILIFILENLKKFGFIKVKKEKTFKSCFVFRKTQIIFWLKKTSSPFLVYTFIRSWDIAEILIKTSVCKMPFDLVTKQHIFSMKVRTLYRIPVLRFSAKLSRQHRCT